MWFVIIMYAEGLEVVKETFPCRQTAEAHVERVAQIDGPKYAVAYSSHWGQLTSNPNWEVTEV